MEKLAATEDEQKAEPATVVTEALGLPPRSLTGEISQHATRQELSIMT